MDRLMEDEELQHIIKRIIIECLLMVSMYHSPILCGRQVDTSHLMKLLSLVFRTMSVVLRGRSTSLLTQHGLSRLRLVWL